MILTALTTSAFVLFSLTSAVTPGARLAEWEVHDSLGRPWTEELLYYDLELKPPIDAAKPLAVKTDNGKPALAQVLTRQTSATGMVTRVRLALLTDLEPFGQRRFHLVAANPTEVASDLSVAQEADR